LDSQKTLLELTPMQPSQKVTPPSQDALTSMNHLKANLPPAQTGLVSVIIPAYNGEKYIAQAVESVLNQTYSNYEILVVDDGSTDNTRGVLEPYLDKIQYVYQENQGVAVARNRGIEMSRGEFVAFLDQDDFFLPHKLALQVACFELQPTLGMVHSGWRRVNAAGENIADAQPWKDVPTLDLEGWVLWKCVLLSAMMFRREWLERVGGLDPQFKQSDDVDLALRLSLLGCETAWVRQSVVCYREHEGNASRNIQVQARENLAVLDKFFTLLNVPEHIQKLENHCLYYATLWIAWRFYSAGLFSEMAEYLQQSLNYREDAAEAIDVKKIQLNWIDTFTDISTRQEEQFDVKSLTNRPEWIQLHTYLELKQLKYQFSQVQAELERSNGELHQKNEELGQTKAELQQVRNQLEQSQSQLRDTTEQLAQTQAQFQQQTQDLEQSQVQLHQKNADLEECQSLLHQTEEVLEQSQSQLQETEKVLEQSVEQLKQSREKAQQFESQLHQTQEELEQSQAQLHHKHTELEQSQAQLRETEAVLEQSQSHLHETEKVLEEVVEQLKQSQKEAQKYQSQIHLTQEELEQSQLKLQQKHKELEEYRNQLEKNQKEAQQFKSHLYQGQEELVQLALKLKQVQEERDWLEAQSQAWMETAQKTQAQLQEEKSWLESQVQAWMQAAQQANSYLLQ
jgi:glycosyltransferase involved in cell wall biosynthesis/chromosome segregation ATPase